MILGFIKRIDKEQVEIETPDHNRIWIEVRRIASSYNLGDVLVEDVRTGQFHVDFAATQVHLKQVRLLSDKTFD